jgi:hypothetical protein
MRPGTLYTIWTSSCTPQPGTLAKYARFELVIISVPFLDSQPLSSPSYCRVDARTYEEDTAISCGLVVFFIDIQLRFLYLQLFQKRVLIKNLLKDLQEREGLAYLLIAHNLATVR